MIKLPAGFGQVNSGVQPSNLSRPHAFNSVGSSSPFSGSERIGLARGQPGSLRVPGIAPAFVPGLAASRHKGLFHHGGSLRQPTQSRKPFLPRLGYPGLSRNTALLAKMMDDIEAEYGSPKAMNDGPCSASSQGSRTEKKALKKLSNTQSADVSKGSQSIQDPTLRAFTDLSLLFSKVSQMMRWEADAAARTSEGEVEATQGAVSTEQRGMSQRSGNNTKPELSEWLKELPLGQGDNGFGDVGLSQKGCEGDKSLPNSARQNKSLMAKLAAEDPSQWDTEQARERLEQALEEVYSLTFNAALAVAFLSVKAYLAHAPLEPDLVRMTRWLMDRLNALAFDAPPNVEFAPADIPGTEAEWVLNAENKDSKNLVIFVPGGCYLFETPHKQVLGMMVQAADTRALKLTIPTVLEAAFPAQMNVIAKALDHLLDTNQVEMENLYLMGDSAGGHAIMSYLTDRMMAGKPVPKVILISPWTDFTLSGESLESNRPRDHFIPPERMPEIVDLMKGDTPIDDPRLSPAVALKNVHPDHQPQSAFLVCSDTEVLRDDSVRLAQRLTDLGWSVDLNVYSPSRDHEILPHAFAAVPGLVPQGLDALEKMAEFVSKRENSAQ